MTHPFYIVDVFAESKYAGNQLAVIRHAADLSTETMQLIAREMHFAETTFILSDEPRNGGYDVRIFTVESELPFAGHPTLGTSFVIASEIIGKPVDTLTLNLGVGPIPVTFKGDDLWMKQIPPQFGETFEEDKLVRVLRIEAEQVDRRFPIQAISTGIPFIITPLKTLAAVRNVRPDWERFRQLFPGVARAILVFAPETYSPEHDLNVRVFVDEVGVPEDPATGSANGCLAGYLVKYRYFDSPNVEVRVEQGYEIKRPSLLLLRAAEQEGAIHINVGGRVFLVARGELV